MQISPLWDKQRANTSYLTWLLQQEHTNHSERMLNVQTEGEAGNAIVCPAAVHKIYLTCDGYCMCRYRGRYVPLLQIQNTINVSCHKQMSVNAEELWPNAETKNVQQHMRTLPTVYLILVNPLAFCQNLMNFSLHQVNKRSQSELQNLLVTKHPDLVIYLSNNELRLPCVSLKISRRLWSPPCHVSYTFGLKD